MLEITVTPEGYIVDLADPVTGRAGPGCPVTCASERALLGLLGRMFDRTDAGQAIPDPVDVNITVTEEKRMDLSVCLRTVLRE